MPKLLSELVLRDGGSGQYITLSGAQPALGPTPSTASGSTIITDAVGNTTYSNIIGDIIFSSGSLTNSILDQSISINTVGTGSFIINAPTQFNNTAQFNTSSFITARVTGNFGSTSTTTGALIVNQGVGVGENITLGGDLIFSSAEGLIRAPRVRILGTATSTSTTTGAITVVGGVGIGRDVVIGGNLTLNSAQGTVTSPNIVVSGLTNSYSTDTGALIVYGGVGVGGSINASSIFDNSTRVISQVVAGVGLSGGGVGPGVILTNTGVLSLTAGTGTNVSQNTGNIVVWIDPVGGQQTLQTVTDAGNSTTNIVYFNTSTNATSSTVAGVVIAGGLGVVKNVIISGDLTVRDIRARYVDVDLFQSRGNASIYHLDISSPDSSTSSLASNALYVNGGAGIQKDLTVGGNGFFYGNVTILGTFTTISSSIADIGRKVVALSTSAGPSFLSIDSGITVGPISSPFVKFLFDGNDSWKSTGNIISDGVGTYNLGSSANPWGYLYTQNANISGNSNSVSTTTGALTVVGGLGVGGTIYAGTIYSNGQVVSPGVANTSSGIGGGQLGSIPIQFAPGQTAFIPIGSPNTLLVSNGTTATWITTSSLGIGTGVNSLGAGTDTAISTSTGNITIWNNSTLQSVTVRGGTTNRNIVFTNNTQATSTSTGTLVVTGGVGIGRNLHVGGSIYSQGSEVVTAASLNTYGVSKLTAGTDTAINTSTGDVVIWNTSTLQTVTDRGNITYNSISILNPTTSTFNGLGALTVAGGVSVGGSLYSKAIYDDRNRVVTSINPVAGLGVSITDVVTTGTTATFKINITGVINVLGTGTISVNTDASGTVTVTNLGVTGLLAGTDTAISSNTGTVTVWNTGTLQSVTNRGSSTTNAISITSTASSTSTITGALIVAGGVGIGGNLNVNGKITVTDQTDSASTDTGSLIIAGGLGVAKSIYSKFLVVDSDFSNISVTASNAIYAKGGLGVDGSGRFGSSVQIDSFVNIAGIASITNNTHATTSNAGALRVTGGAYVGDNLVVMGDTYINGNSVFVGQVTVIGTSTFVYSTNTVYTDNIIELHSPSTGSVWTLNDGRDIGLKFHYYDTQDRNSFLGRNNVTGYLDWIGDGTEAVNTFSGIYGTFRTGAIKLIGGTSATNTYSGDLTVEGGTGIGGNLYVGGSIFGSVSGNINGTANTATNIANGAAGQVPYQSSTGITAFFGPGTAGQLLVSSGTNAPLYISTGSLYVGRSETSTFATSSTNIVGGAAGQILYQSSTGTTLFVGPGTAGQLLVSSGTNAPLYISTGSLYVGRSEISTYASTSTNIAGGVIGQLLYQSSAGATGFVSVGAGGQVLMSFGSSSPSFVNTNTLYVGLSDLANLATTATNIGGGNNGAIPYQLSNGNTGFIGIGTVGQVLSSDGSLPYWAAATGGGGGTTNILSSTSTVSLNNFYIPFLSTSSFDSFVFADPGLRYTPSTHSITSTGSVYATSLYDSNRRVVTSVVATAGTGINITSLVSTGTSTSFTISNSGVTSITAGTDTSINTTTGIVTIWNTSTLQTVSDRGSSTTNAVSITNTSSSTSTITGALIVAGGAGIGGAVYIGETSYVSGAQIVTTATVGNYAASFVGGTVPLAVNITSSTQATSTNSGALRVAGGVGIGGNLYVGGEIVAEKLTIQYTTVTTTQVTTDDIISTYNTTNSTSTNTGALQVAGGVGIGGTVYIGGSVFIAGALSVTTSSLGTYAVTSITAGTDTVVTTATGAVTIYSTATLQSVSNRGSTTTNAIRILNTATSTSTTTGALVIAGGIGIGGDLYVGNSLVFPDNLKIANSVISNQVIDFGGDLVAGSEIKVSLSTTTIINKVLNALGGGGSPPSLTSQGQVAVDSNKVVIAHQIINDQGATSLLTSQNQIEVNANNILIGYKIVETTTGTTTSTFSGWTFNSTGNLTASSTASSTSTTTGALIVTGGVGVGGSVTAGQGFVTNNTLIASYTSPVISTTSTQNLDSWSTSSYRTAKYLVQLVDTGFSPYRVHASEMTVIHDGAGNVYKTEYGINTSVGELGTFNAIASGTNVQIQFTPSFPVLTPTSLTIKMSRITITS